MSTLVVPHFVSHPDLRVRQAVADQFFSPQSDHGTLAAAVLESYAFVEEKQNG